jgi:DNA-binding response OmpR family regulator
MSVLPKPAASGVTSAFGSGTYSVARSQRLPVVVLDRDARTRTVVSATLGDFHVHESEGLSSAAMMINELRPRVVVCSMAFDPVELLFFARWLRSTFGRTVVLIMLTRPGDTAQAILALQCGARACIELPVDPRRLRLLMTKHAV